MTLKHFFFAVAAIATIAGLSACSETKKDDAGQAGSDADKKVVLQPVAIFDYMPKYAADPMPDGAYHVSFEAIGLNDEGKVDMDFKNCDVYNAKDVEALEPGNDIMITGKQIEVTSVDKSTDENGAPIVTVNKSEHNSGYRLRREDDGYYHAIKFDNYPEYYSIGKVYMQIAPDVHFIDESDPTKRVETNGRQAIRNTANTYYNSNVTTVSVKDNKVVQIVRYME